MEPTKKRSGKSRVNDKSAKVKRRLEFTSETMIESLPVVPSIVPSIAPSNQSSTSAEPIMAPSQDIQLSLGGNKFLTYGLFNGEPRISIRLFQVRGKMLYPSKTGISMSATRFSQFRYMTPLITEGVIDMDAKRTVDLTSHLFNSWYVSIKTSHPCVNIRKFFYPQNSTEPIPTKTGVTLTIDQWKELLVQIDQLLALVPELTIVPRCVENHGEGNLLAVLECSECSHISSGFMPYTMLGGGE